MKLFVAILTALVSTYAEASYFQNSCSSPNATTRVESGHAENYLSVTRHVPTDGRMRRKIEVIELDHSDINVETSARTELERSSSSSCKPGDDYGIGSWKNISTKKIKITKKDGSAFEEGFVGLSNDGLAIEAYLICQNVGNSMMPCSKTE